MITISKSKLKSTMLEVFRKAEESGEEIIVTHFQKPVLRILPIETTKSVDQAFSQWRGTVPISKKILLEPTDSDWNFDS